MYIDGHGWTLTYMDTYIRTWLDINMDRGFIFAKPNNILCNQVAII